MNRVIVAMQGGGWAFPVDQDFTYETVAPKRIGDDATIKVHGKRLMVRRLKAVNRYHFLVEQRRGAKYPRAWRP